MQFFIACSIWPIEIINTVAMNEENQKIYEDNEAALDTAAAVLASVLFALIDHQKLRNSDVAALKQKQNE